jgi:hypothetical protein
MRRVVALILCLAFLPTSAVRAEAVTLRDIIDLTRAGLGDDVLLALIEVDGGVFTIDTPTLTRLKEAGVSERVILALVRSGRTRPAEPAAAVAAPRDSWQEPQIILIEHEHPVVQQVAVPVAIPVYVPVPVRLSGRARVRATHQPLFPHSGFGPLSGFGVPFPQTAAAPPVKAAERVYWGWGGKRRPDAWKEAPKK